MANPEIPCTDNDPEWWHPLGATLIPENYLAIDMCETCPLRSACLTIALFDGEVGIWGATTTEYRRAWGSRGERVMEINEARRTMAGRLAGAT